jgi:two-component system response regulator DegU
MAVRIVLADDHMLVRQGLRALLEREKFEVVGEASDGLEAIQLAGEHQPDIMTLDVGMPTLNGISAMADILKVSPKTRIILLTMHTEEHWLLQALRIGAKGCVLKSQAAEHLIHAIREVHAGGVCRRMSRGASYRPTR